MDIWGIVFLALFIVSIVFVSLSIWWFLNKLKNQTEILKTKEIEWNSKAETINRSLAVQENEKKILTEKLALDREKIANEYATKKLQDENHFNQKLQSIASREKQLESAKQEFKKIQSSVFNQERFIKSERQILEQKKHSLQDKNKIVDEKINEVNSALEKVAEMDKKSAQDMLIANYKESLKTHFASELKSYREKLESNKKEIASGILATAIDRYSNEVVSERAVVSLKIKPEDKGRIIGKEGRNIRAFEHTTGVEVQLDDSEMVGLSCFSPIRRELARRTLLNLLKDGRVQPIRIEKIYNKNMEKLSEEMFETGKKTIEDLDLKGVPSEMFEIIGKLKYRFGYGQNALLHSIEVASFSGLIAADLELDVSLAKKAGFFHDIGKAMDHEIDDDHVSLGAKIAKKHDLGPEVLDAILCHHETEPAKTVYGVIAKAADAISAARPGARNLSYDQFVKRMTKIEEICKSFPEIENAYALGSGKELRVMVNPKKVDDEHLELLAFDISKKINENAFFHGEMHITMIREMRYETTAKPPRKQINTRRNKQHHYQNQHN